MKPASLAAITSLLAAPAAAVEYTVTTCANLADVDDTQVTGLTIDTSTFACDEYTRFRVRNAMVLRATVPAVKFGNFSLKVLGELTVEPDVTFNGVVDQLRGGVLMNNGDVININAGSHFELNFDTGSGDGGLGGAIYNTNGGVVTLMGSTTFRENWAYWGGAIYTSDGDYEYDGPASAITFPDDTVFEDNTAKYCPDVHNGDNDNCPVV